MIITHVLVEQEQDNLYFKGVYPSWYSAHAQQIKLTKRNIDYHYHTQYQILTIEQAKSTTIYLER